MPKLSRTSPSNEPYITLKKSLTHRLAALSNVGSCCAFTEAFPSPALRAYSIDYLFRNLDTALAAGMCNDLSERTWCALLTPLGGGGGGGGGLP
jgi:hypothetical protein